MTARLRVIAGLCVAMSAALALQLARSATRAGEEALARRVERAAALQRQLDELAALRAQVASVEASDRPQQDLIARVEAALAEAGLPTAHLRDLVTDSDRELGRGTGYRRQAVQVTLAGLTPAQIGRFLLAWCNTQPTWTVDRIECTHTGDDDPTYDARLRVAATYLAPEVR